MKNLTRLSAAALLALGLSAGSAGLTASAYRLPSAWAAPSYLCENAPDADAPGLTPDMPETGLPDLPEQAPDTEQPGLPDSDSSQTPDAGSSYAAQVVSLVNAERAAQGLSALTIDARVTAAAQVRAGELHQSFSHTRPDGRSCFTALAEAGASYRGAGENIAYGQSSPQQVVQAWMDSPGHRANILSNKYTKIGVGYTVKNGVAYWAQLFTY